MGRKIQEHYLRSLEADNDRLLEENRRLREVLERVLECEWMVEPFESQVQNWDEIMNDVEDALKGGGNDD